MKAILRSGHLFLAAAIIFPAPSAVADVALPFGPQSTLNITTSSSQTWIIGDALSPSVSLFPPGCDTEEKLEITSSDAALSLSTFFVNSSCTVTINVPAHVHVNVPSSFATPLIFTGTTASLTVIANGSVVVADSGDTPIFLPEINGTIDISRASGPISVVSSNGKVTLNQTFGQLDISGTNGGIEAYNIELPANTFNRIASGNGRVYIREVTTPFLPDYNKKAGLRISVSASNGSAKIKARYGVKGRSYARPGPQTAALKVHAGNGNATVKP